MDLKQEVPTSIPKPFDLSRFISAAITFLVKVQKVTVLLDGTPLSSISKSRVEQGEIKLPRYLKAASSSKMMRVISVKAFSGCMFDKPDTLLIFISGQSVNVVMSASAYNTGTKKPHSNRKRTRFPAVNPAARPGFFDDIAGSADAEGNHATAETPSSSEQIFSIGYTVHSVDILSTPTHEMAFGIQAATKKEPVKRFSLEAVHVSCRAI